MLHTAEAIQGSWKRAESFVKSHPSYPKGFADLVYVYTLQDKNDKAKKQFDEVLKGLTKNASVIRNMGSAFLTRGLYEQANIIYERGNKLMEGEDTFYLDQAGRRLFLHEQNPPQ